MPDLMPETVIYLGPSLSRAEALSILQAEYRPPICRGDLGKLPRDVKTVGIIDGEFFQNLAVSPKEILPLLERGVRVLGASSMGALRAAEMHTLGMMGVGEVFAMFRDGVLDADDEVALIYDPATYRALSEPLVNIRRALQMARAAGAIEREEMERLLDVARDLYFPDRSYRALTSLSGGFAAFVRGASLPDLKRDDARALLHAVREMRR
jgi:hypothetical protein